MNGEQQDPKKRRWPLPNKPDRERERLPNKAVLCVHNRKPSSVPNKQGSSEALDHCQCRRCTWPQASIRNPLSRRFFPTIVRIMPVRRASVQSNEWAELLRGYLHPQIPVSCSPPGSSVNGTSRMVTIIARQIRFEFDNMHLSTFELRSQYSHREKVRRVLLFVRLFNSTGNWSATVVSLSIVKPERVHLISWMILFLRPS